MPPKAPNLKFRPKLVVRSEGASTNTTDTSDDLSLVQLARMQGIQLDPSQEGHQRNTQQHQQQHLEPLRSSTSATASITSGAGVGAGRGGGVATTRFATPRGQEAGTPAANATGASLLYQKGSSGGHLSQSAALELASRRQGDLSLVPAEAPGLPLNSMNSIVSAPGADSGFYHTTTYPPLPLDSMLLSSSGGPAGGSSDAVPTDPSELQLPSDGTAFLREGARELQEIRAANTRFYEERMKEQPDDFGFASATATSGASKPGTLVWLQLPAFQENGPFSFDELPPGRVGELKVLRSGRMVLEIAGVYYDVAVEGYTGDGEDGACSMAVATQPNTASIDPSSKSSCYELGLLLKKLVCTPTIP